MSRITSKDVNQAVANLGDTLKRLGLLPEDAEVAISAGSKTNGESWGLMFRVLKSQCKHCGTDIEYREAMKDWASPDSAIHTVCSKNTQERGRMYRPFMHEPVYGVTRWQRWLPAVDLHGAFTAHEVHARITAALRALSAVELHLRHLGLLNKVLETAQTDRTENS